MQLKTILLTGIKVISAIAGGAAIIFGIDKLTEKFSNKPSVSPTVETDVKTTNLSFNKVVGKIKRGQFILLGILKIVGGISSIVKVLSKLFNTGNTATPDSQNYEEASNIYYDEDEASVFIPENSEGALIKRGNIIECY